MRVSRAQPTFFTTHHQREAEGEPDLPESAKPTPNYEQSTTNYPRPTPNGQLPTTNYQRPTPNVQRPTKMKNRKTKKIFKKFQDSLVVGRWLKRLHFRENDTALHNMAVGGATTD